MRKNSTIGVVIWLIGFAIFSHLSLAEAYLFVNKAYEQQVGAQYSAEIESQSQITASNEMFNSTVMNLWKHFEPNSPSYKFRIIDDNSLNAFCVPGGYIYITAPMMRYVNSKDELAFVIAHEIGHQQREHFLREVDNALTAQAGFAILGAALKQQKLADITHQVVARTTMRGFGFKKEFEADTYGFELATASGYNPGAGAVFFYRLRRDMGEGEENDSRQAGYLRPHPANSKRIAKQLEVLTAYSNNKVSVSGNSVFINGIKALTPDAYGPYSSEERSYIVAGLFAQAYHINRNAKFYITENNSVACNGVVVFANREEGDLNYLVSILNK